MTQRRGRLIAARDPIGIRPLYYGCDWRTAPWLSPARPRTWWGCAKRFCPSRRAATAAGGEFIRYADPARADQYLMADLKTPSAGNMHDQLTAGVEKRLDADAPLGFLLSGGLD